MPDPDAEVVGGGEVKGEEATSVDAEFGHLSSPISIGLI